jgi:hypothetical protein
VSLVTLPDGLGVRAGVVVRRSTGASTGAECARRVDDGRAVPLSATSDLAGVVALGSFAGVGDGAGDAVAQGGAVIGGGAATQGVAPGRP